MQDKSGYLQVYTNKGSWVPFWFVIHGGFLTAYTNPTVIDYVMGNEILT